MKPNTALGGDFSPLVVGLDAAAHAVFIEHKGLQSGYAGLMLGRAWGQLEKRFKHLVSITVCRSSSLSHKQRHMALYLALHRKGGEWMYAFTTQRRSKQQLPPLYANEGTWPSCTGIG